MSLTRSALLAGTVLASAPGAAAADLPAGTRLQVRLTQNVYSHAAAPGQPVETVVIAPVRVADRVAIAPGWKLKGSVIESGTLPGREKRARLRLGFTSLVAEGGAAFPVEGRVVEVDGARESVDAEGRMIGVAPQKGLPRDPDALLRLAVQLDPVALGLMEASGQTVRAAVGYDRGVEMTVELTTPATVNGPTGAGPRDLPAAELKALAGLPALAGAEALQLLLAGTREQVESAFREAGYLPSDALWAKAGPRAFLALAQRSGYRPAPAPQLEGRDADLSFEKQNNTLARRHRVRLWARSETLRGQPTWLGAAARCVDLAFDKAGGTFRHRVDPDANAAREKVAQDLVSARRVSARGAIERKSGADGRVAVLVLQ